MSNTLIIFIASIVCMIAGATISAFAKNKDEGVLLEFLGGLAFGISIFVLLIN